MAAGDGSHPGPPSTALASCASSRSTPSSNGSAPAPETHTCPLPTPSSSSSSSSSLRTRHRQQAPELALNGETTHSPTALQRPCSSRTAWGAGAATRRLRLLLSVGFLLCASFRTGVLAALEDAQTSGRLSLGSYDTLLVPGGASLSSASAQHHDPRRIDVTTPTARRHLLNSNGVVSLALQQQGHQLQQQPASRPSLRAAVAAGMVTAAAAAVAGSPPWPPLPPPPSPPTGASTPQKTAPKAAGGSRKRPPLRRPPSPSRRPPSPRPPPLAAVRTRPPPPSPPPTQPPSPPPPSLPSPPPQVPQPPNPPEPPSLPPLVPPSPPPPSPPLPPFPRRPPPPRPPRPPPPRPSTRAPSPPSPLPPAGPLPPFPRPPHPPSPPPPSPPIPPLPPVPPPPRQASPPVPPTLPPPPRALPPLPPLPPRPSPRPTLESKDGSGELDPTGSDSSDEGTEEPAWPPLQPSPPIPVGAPSPPPPAAPEIIGRYDQIGNAMMIAVHLMAVPGTDRFFFMERPSGRHPDGSRTIAGFLDLRTRRWTHVHSPDGLFCAGHTFLNTGDLLVVGGHQANAGYPDGMKSIRTFNRSCTDLQLRKIRDMGWRRWYPSVTLLPDGKVLVMGGTQGVGAGTANNQFWELYDHAAQRLTPYAMRTAYLDSAQQVYYPFNYVLPTGLLFTFCGRTGWILDWNHNNWTQAVPRLRGYATTQFPFTGTSVMLGLYPERDYEVEVMLFGGQAERAIRNLTTVAARGIQRLKLVWDPAAGNYSFDGWHEESLSMGRLMPDAVLLPNGKVVVLNGAREGLAGDSANGGDSRANYPLLFADLYDPDRPRGSRVRRLAMTRIPRMYHSTACLTTNGTILVAGCDRCHRFLVDFNWPYDESPTGKADYRVEIFSPPYFFLDALKPRIELVQGEVMWYDTPFDIAYSWPALSTGSSSAEGLAITRVVLVAPCSCTHSYDMNQRLVGLRIVADWTGGLGSGSGSAFGFATGATRAARASSERALAAAGEHGGGSSASGGAGVADGGVLTVTGPPNPNIAPPGMYMLFLLNGEVYSSAVWVRLES